MFFLTNKMEKDLTTMTYDEGYDNGYETGYNNGYEDGYKEAYNAAQLSIAEQVLERANKALEGLEDENRRLEQVYTWAYDQGATDALAKQGIIDIDGIVKELEKDGV